MKKTKKIAPKKVTGPKEVPQEKIDRRSQTSAENGSKGGRPAGTNAKSMQFLIKKEDIKEAILKEDIALAIEKAFKRAMPHATIYVQTRKRLEAANINYDPNGGNLNLVLVNAQPFKFPWELRYFINEFVQLTKGTHDYRFEMKLPRELHSDVA